MNRKQVSFLIVFFLIFGAIGTLFAGGGKQGSAGSGGRTTINFYTWLGRAGVYPESLIAAFEQKNPNTKVINDGRTIAVDLYVNTQKIRLLSGDGIDVTSIRPETLREYAKAGYLEKLDDNDPFLRNYSPAMLEMIRVDGALYSTPTSINIIGVYYNKDMFRRLGLTVPTNWNEYIVMLDRIKAAGITPMMNGGRDGWPMEFDVYPIIHDVLVKDPQIFTKIANGQAKYTDPVWVNAFNKIRDFYAKGYVRNETVSMGYEQALTLFLQGQTAIHIQGEWIMGDMDGVDTDGNVIKAPFEIGVFPIPHNMPGEPQVAPVSIGASQGIVAKSRNKEVAKKFLEFMSTTEAAGYFGDMGMFSAVSGSPLDFHPMAKLWLPVKDMPRSLDFFYSLQAPAVNAEMLKQLQLMFLGQATTQQVLREMQAVQDSLR
jgi:raffinose/stachyose/melibiose transport system substrate-binding protein